MVANFSKITETCVKTNDIDEDRSALIYQKKSCHQISNKLPLLAFGTCSPRYENGSWKTDIHTDMDGCLAYFTSSFEKILIWHTQKQFPSNHINGRNVSFCTAILLFS